VRTWSCTIAEADQAVVIRLDEPGPLTLQPTQAGKGWAAARSRSDSAPLTSASAVARHTSDYNISTDELSSPLLPSVLSSTAIALRHHSRLELRMN
jgi:hypothetical protein